MEDDDEFGDLYTDVLQPLSSSSFHQPPPPIQSTPPSVSRPIDLNIKTDDEDFPNSKLSFNFSSSNQNQTLISEPKKAASESIIPEISDSGDNGGVGIGKNWDPIESRVSEGGVDVKLEKITFKDPNFMDETGTSTDLVVDEGENKDGVLVGEDEKLMGKSDDFHNFDIEEADTGNGDLDLEPIIPGLSIAGNSENYPADENLVTRDEASGDDWDSDSEDDLQIVLNDSNHGPMAMEMGAEDDDEGEDPLVVLADNDPNHQPMDEQEWGEDAAQGADGERKELGDAGKVNGVVMMAPPKMGYTNHGYHPFSSQFKYVRPGAAPIPVSAGPIGGRGRGDWRPAGIKNASPMQKPFQPGFGMSAWGNNAAGRGFGSGLEFTLPSYKTIFDVEVDSFEEKPWRLPGIDLSNFFNFGLNEESWKDYRKQLEQLRMETTMQSKIRVYESGRTEQDYDPDLPPELAAAAGIHVLSENASLGKTDAGQSDLANTYANMRPPLPIGRPIQVETGYGERLPSIDTRPPRIRDSDAIIEIVLQDSGDNSVPENDVAEKSENDPSREDLGDGHEIEENIAQDDTERFDGFPNAYNGRKREPTGRRAPFVNAVRDTPSEKDGILSLSPEALSKYHHEERCTKGTTHNRSPNMTPSEGTQDKGLLDNQKEDSVETVSGKHSPVLSSPASTGTLPVPADRSAELEMEEMALDKTTNTFKDENLKHSTKRQKLSSQVEQPSSQEIDNGDDSKAASSENSRDHQKLHDDIDDEVVQGGRPLRVANIERSLCEDEQSVRRKRSEERERRQVERHRMVVKGREDSYSRRDMDTGTGHYSQVKTEVVERQKERESSDVARQWRDDVPHGKRIRPEDTRKWDRSGEMEPMNRPKVRESERSYKDELVQLRKQQLDNSSYRGHRDKDMGSSHRERDDILKNRSGMDDLRSKRRTEEEHSRREYDGKEIILPVPRDRDITTHRKREREDVLDQRKRDYQVRTREDDHHYVKHKEEDWFQRERDERHRLKQLHEESLLKREREDGRGVRSERAGEDKLWVGHTRVKNEFKGSDRDSQYKDVGRQSEQLKRRDRVDDASLSQHRGREDVYARGNQINNDERRSRQERASTQTDRAPENHRVKDKKHKDYLRKSKESEGGDNYSISKKNQEDLRGQTNEPVILRGTSGRGINEGKISANHHSSKKHKEDASSEDEQHDSRRGRSKLERWTSHKERDFGIGTKSSSSLKNKEIERYNNGGSPIVANKLLDESSKTRELVDNKHVLGNEKDVAGNLEIKNVDVKAAEERHLDTVEKLKKRRERFKLPLLSEKEPTASKKIETEPLPSVAQSETHAADSEIKPERPARKRRWISN